MKNILLFLKSNLKRNMVTVIIAIIISFLICFTYISFGNSFGGAETDNIVVGFLDNDKSSISVDFKKYLKEELHMDTIENLSYDEFTYELIDHKISAIIEIPSGMEQSGILSGELPGVTTTTLDDYENAAFIKSYINIYFSSVDMLMKAAAGDSDKFAESFHKFQNEKGSIQQEAAYVANEKEDAARIGIEMAVGFFTMLMTILCLCIALVVMDDRQTGVFNRIQVSPVKSEQYIIGTTLFAIITSLFIVMVFGIFLIIRQDPYGISVGYLLLAMSLFALIMLGFALNVALFCKSNNAMITAVFIVGMIGPILGGAYFPVDAITGTLGKVTRLTPHYWLMQGIKDLQENSGADVRTNLIILTLFAVLSFLIASVKYVQKGNSRV